MRGPMGETTTWSEATKATWGVVFPGTWMLNLALYNSSDFWAMPKETRAMFVKACLLIPPRVHRISR
jgi:hypothetical protein